MWSDRPFVARGAFANAYATWVDITLVDRPASCSTQRLRSTDLAIQLSIPTGPEADFFADQPLAVPLQLSGAGGVSTVPAGHVTAQIERFSPQPGATIRGTLSFHFPTALDAQAPVYESSGAFSATVCAAAAPVASLPAHDQQQPAAGTVAGKPMRFPTFLAYSRPDGRGGHILSLKAYPELVECHQAGAPPYLYGPEFGSGSDGRYHAGARMPARWVMQMRTPGEHSERSVHATAGAGLLHIHDVNLSQNGYVRGSMAATTVDETEERWSFQVAGAFEAKMCGTAKTAW